MTHELIVEENKTYNIQEGTKETHKSATIEENAQLDINGQLELTGKDTSGQISPNDFDLPLTGINIPMEIDSLRMVSMGTSMFLTLILGITAFTAVALRNYFGMVFWGLSVIILVLSGVYGLGLGLFWGSIVLTVVVIMLGAALRVST